MAKFFIPVLAFLIGLWVYVVLQEQNKNNTSTTENQLVKTVEEYVKIRDSIIKSPKYSNFKEVTFNKISVMLPSYLDTTSSLSTSAYLQHENLKKEFYFLLYTSTTSEYTSIEDFYNATLDGIKNAVTSYRIIDTSYKKINNYNVYRADITGIFFNGYDSLPLKYNILVALIGDTYYDITQWTLVNNIEQNEEDLNIIMSSFLYKPNIEEIRSELNSSSFLDLFK
ncbi:MAG: hypothetical protein A2X08_00405 [Bacteroidetes bacterium GWA2_32_17]|nr:MAG: hypothetical protein A2X08_00405 [Bacteroidetes bacterium GWA2_32_17]